MAADWVQDYLNAQEAKRRKIDALAGIIMNLPNEYQPRGWLPLTTLSTGTHDFTLDSLSLKAIEEELMQTRNEITLSVDDILREELQRKQMSNELERKRNMAAAYGLDDFKNGTVIAFEKNFDKKQPVGAQERNSNTGVSYQYAAIKIQGLWYVTCSSQRPLSPMDWPSLVLWLLNGDYPTEASNVTVMEAGPTVGDRASSSRAIEAGDAANDDESNLNVIDEEPDWDGSIGA